MFLESRIKRRLDELAQAGQTRVPPAIEQRCGVRYKIDGKSVVGFCSNDYLGLLADPPKLESDKIGTSFRSQNLFSTASSRLVCGDHAMHRALETQISRWLNYEDCVLFSSGYALNTGVIPALIESQDHIYSDRLNHASIIDGIRLTKAKCTRLEHNCSPPLVPVDPSCPNWWITESTFSMDGDQPNIAALRAYQQKGNAVYIDDAHSVGLYSKGYGFSLAHDFRPTILVGTFGKAFAATGAYLCASKTICEWIRSRARSFVFSTAFSPLLAAHIQAKLDLIRGGEGDRRRTLLRANLQHLSAALGIDLPDTPIIPLPIGENQTALAISNTLREDGFHIQAIRPPTVAPGSARLRLTCTAAHTHQQIEQLAEALKQVFSKHEIPLVSNVKQTK